MRNPAISIIARDNDQGRVYSALIYPFYKKPRTPEEFEARRGAPIFMRDENNRIVSDRDSARCFEKALRWLSSENLTARTKLRRRGWGGRSLPSQDLESAYADVPCELFETENVYG